MTATPSHLVGRRIVRDPLVILSAAESRELPIGPAPLLAAAIGDRPAWFLVRPSWSWESARRIARVAAAWHTHRANHPRQRVVMLCNTAREHVLLQEQGVASALAPQNIVVDETVFAVEPDAPKTFDAIYVGRIAAYKRHHLAANVASLALVHPALYPGWPSELATVRAALPHAVFLNARETADRLAALPPGPAATAARRLVAVRGDAVLPPPRVAHWMNRARVGLCLSAEEGAMLASMEYLMCGLAVVSTRSRGGRERYFDPAFCRIVDDDPAAVAAAVAELAAARLDPLAIRAATLARVAQDRRDFVALVQAIVDEAGGTEDFSRRFSALLREGLFPMRPAATLVAEVAAP